MLQIIKDIVQKVMKSRFLPISIVYIILFATIISQLFYLQIVKGDDYNNTMELKAEQERDLKSTRGNIRDRNGKLLAYNELSYAVTLEDTGDLATNEEKNEMIHRLIQIIEENGGKLASDFPLSFNESGEVEFNVNKNEELRFKKDIYYHSKVEEVTAEERDASPLEVYEYLRNGSKNNKMFDITDIYTQEEALKIMTVRYGLFMNTWKKYIPITVAINVNDKTVAAVKENSATLPGADILQETHRVYAHSKYFSHILGYTGLITQEAIEGIKEEGRIDNYTYTDQIGKSGIEKQYEAYLHGVKGYESVIVNEANRVLEVKSTEQPIAGDDIYVTIDADLHIATYDILEKKIAGVLASKIRNSTSAGSKGVNSTDIVIPIYDVYFALIDNNVIDIEALALEDATDLEKSVNKKFTQKRKEVFADLEDALALNNNLLKKNTNDEMKDNLEYVYEFLKKRDVILTKSIDQKDNIYLSFIDDNTSLSKFLQHAISNNWIDLKKLDIQEEFYSTDELYSKLLEYIFNALKQDGEFNKKVYHSLVYSYKLTGTEICLLLFDQGVLKYNEGEIANLKNGTISAYTFLLNKIKNLDITPAQLALDPSTGSVVVTDVNTGDVLALVSYPSYDNNKLANTVDSKYFNKLFEDNSYPMLNRPLQQKTAPGSTYKMVAATAALEEGVVQVGERIYDKGVFEKIKPSPKCWIHPNGNHGAVDTIGALEVSCNYYFYEIAYRLSQTSTGKYDSSLGLSKIAKYATMYGLDATSGIELPEYTPRISDESSVRSAIGQGTNNFTPAQLARYTTAIANKGTAFNLTILDKIIDVSGNVVVDNKATVYKKMDLKQSTWTQIHKGMYDVVNGAKSSIDTLYRDLAVKVAGKTGTAQESTLKPNHALFVSYAPYDKPEISVVVTIPYGYSSSNSAEIARDVYKYYYKSNDYEEVLNKAATDPEINIPIGD